MELDVSNENLELSEHLDLGSFDRVLSIVRAYRLRHMEDVEVCGVDPRRKPTGAATETTHVFNHLHRIPVPIGTVIYLSGINLLREFLHVT
jgi:hypothetical protein